jgi:hypothetical protein
MPGCSRAPPADFAAAAIDMLHLVEGTYARPCAVPKPLPVEKPLTANPASNLKLRMYKHKVLPGRGAMPHCRSATGASQCAVRSDGVVTICNQDDFATGPLFTIDGWNHVKSPRLKTGQCWHVRFHNPTSKPILIKIYNETNPQHRYLLTVYPR